MSQHVGAYGLGVSVAEGHLGNSVGAIGWRWGRHSRVNPKRRGVCPPGRPSFQQITPLPTGGFRPGSGLDG
jgi:hypothetical protein